MIKKVCIGELVCKVYPHTEMFVELLRAIPIAPRTITLRELHKILFQRGWDVTKRTVERSMEQLIQVAPLERIAGPNRTYLWSWKRNTEFCGRSKRELRNG